MSLFPEARAAILREHGASPSQVEELLAYNQNVFSSPQEPASLSPEPHATVWADYCQAAETQGAFAVLQQKLMQLQFPIQAGISHSEAYQQATLQGGSPLWSSIATGLEMEQPDDLTLKMHDTLAGPVPIIIAGGRADFVALLRALAYRNEPAAVPESMGASIIKGYNNWDRIRRYRQTWSAQQSPSPSEQEWQLEFQKLISRKALYQDCFILLSRGNYSGVEASQLGLDPSVWQSLSLAIRLEHECTHYVTRRLFNSMRNNILDELIADYRGMVSATGGQYRADWFLRFLGLEDFPRYRDGGRLQNYRGDPPLSEGSFVILQALVKQAAENLQQFHDSHYPEISRPDNQRKLLIQLTQLTLEALASPDFQVRMHP
jgi:hypothetical protein